MNEMISTGPNEPPSNSPGGKGRPAGEGSLRVLFISRKHPPSVGGMQQLSYQLVSQMKGRVQATAITWGGSQAILPLFFPYALVRSLLVCARGTDLVHLGDPVLTPIGCLLKALFGVRVVVTAHGLDVTFSLLPYQWIIPRLLRSMDRVICISEDTFQACVQRGVPAERCLIIHPGVSIPDSVQPRDESRRWLGQAIGRDLEHTFVLLTVGRLVPRKGVAWFVASVLPGLRAWGQELGYVVVGAGPDEDRVLGAIRSRGLEDVVHLLGRVSEEDLSRAYAAADLFIMPNLRQPGDMEGFGLVALEAAAHGLPVLAADLEGIRDAIVVGRTGELVPSDNVAQWIKTLSQYLNDPKGLQQLAGSARATVHQRFTWTRMVDEYEMMFRQLLRETELKAETR